MFGLMTKKHARELIVDALKHTCYKYMDGLEAMDDDQYKKAMGVAEALGTIAGYLGIEADEINECLTKQKSGDKNA